MTGDRDVPLFLALAMLLLLRANILALDFNEAMAYVCAINGGECDYGVPGAAGSTSSGGAAAGVDGAGVRAVRTGSGFVRPRLPIVEDIVRLALRLTRLTAPILVQRCEESLFAERVAVAAAAAAAAAAEGEGGGSGRGAAANVLQLRTADLPCLFRGVTAELPVVVDLREQPTFAERQLLRRSLPQTIRCIAAPWSKMMRCVCVCVCVCMEGLRERALAAPC